MGPPGYLNGANVKTRDVMTRHVQFIRSDASLEQAASLMVQHDLGALPVFHDGLVVGIVTDREIVRRGVGQGRHPRRTRVSEVMSEHVPCCYEDQDVEAAARIMSDKKAWRLLVVDAGRKPVGIVSVQDLLRSTRDRQLALAVLDACWLAPQTG